MKRGLVFIITSLLLVPLNSYAQKSTKFKQHITFYLEDFKGNRYANEDVWIFNERLNKEILLTSDSLGKLESMLPFGWISLRAERFGISREICTEHFCKFYVTDNTGNKRRYSDNIMVFRYDWQDTVELAAYFNPNSAELLRVTELELLKLVNYLKRKPNLRIQIAGHTDNSGTKQDNIILSQKRALAIRNFLVSNGIASERLEAVGYGDQFPKASNETDEGRALNRRIEVYSL